MNERIMRTAATRFWEPGLSVFTDALAKEERDRLAPLETELKKSVNPAAKARLKEKIHRIKADFKAKRKSASGSLFVKL
jgi:hypothetical protein